MPERRRTGLGRTHRAAYDGRGHRLRGLVLAATFAVLTNMPLVQLVELGFVIAVGVLLDTFLVRTYLVTSASVALGRKVWWPGPLFRRPEPPVPPKEPERVAVSAN